MRPDGRREKEQDQEHAEGSKTLVSATYVVLELPSALGN